MRWGSGDLESIPHFSLKMDIGDNGAIIKKLSKHTRRLLAMKQALDHCDAKEVIHIVKEYILGDQHSNIAKVDRAFASFETSRQIKTLIAW